MKKKNDLGGLKQPCPIYTLSVFREQHFTSLVAISHILTPCTTKMDRFDLENLGKKP